MEDDLLVLNSDNVAFATDSNPELKDLILKSCVKIVDGPESRRAVSLVLSAAELAGESVFPLIDRWETTGCPILEALQQDSDSFLLEVCVKMLKGTLIQDPISVINPRGNRTRAYSFDNSSSISVIHPESMVNFLLSNLKPQISIKITSTIVSFVIARESWVNNVFRSLTDTQRVAIISALLHRLSTDTTDQILEAFLNLPLDGKLISVLLKNDASSLVACSALTDYILSNVTKLATHNSFGQLVGTLFTVLCWKAIPQLMKWKMEVLRRRQQLVPSYSWV